ncbi:3'-5' exonuclease family protein [Mangrovitalea sediminis]|uniref:hypothetical protein n=1 Tax=Mangrovitalea sediminis TaxID=1982043 RepID=UPI0018E9DEDD|nr:hypothetical protein [Mangrovitalea sediminis]
MRAEQARSIDIPPVLDIEASGFGQGSYPVEVGYVLPNGERGCALVRPEPDWTHWDEEAAGLHQIDRTTLEKHGRSAADVAAWLNKILRGQVVYSDAWGQDLSWIGRLYDSADVQPSFRLEALQVLMSESQLRNWLRAREEVQSELQLRRHRASADAWLIQQTFLKTLMWERDTVAAGSQALQFR